MSLFKPLSWKRDYLELLDQRALPHQIRYVGCKRVNDVAEAIRNMTVRGAPAIGIASAFGMYLAAKSDSYPRLLKELEDGAALLISTRPTAVNLRWGIERMLRRARSCDGKDCKAVKDLLLKEAEDIHKEDIEMNFRIGRFGAGLLPQDAAILTHCNAGALATGGHGTALGIVREAFSQGKLKHVYVDETRPRLQGSRLTAWELTQEKIPMTLISDNMAAYMMKTKKIDAVIVGADRIAINGDVANKIGTYSLAIIANFHNVPFYVAAPSSTIDFKLIDGSGIPIEERDGDEILFPLGNNNESIAPKGVNVRNPSFDITPSNLISAIITEQGLFRQPYSFKTPV